MRYLITFAYDGSKYKGYQKQPRVKTIQGELERALKEINNDKQVDVSASGRTDAKVHAYNQKAHFDLDIKITCDKLKQALNSLIPGDIYVKSVVEVKDDFHARFNVKAKEYIYKINMGEYNPIDVEYTLQYCKNIDRKLLDEFINKISGTHNFKSFTSDKDKTNYERTVLVDYKISNKILYLRFESTGFLRYMIRNIVGLLIDINDGKKSITDIEKIFMYKNRTSLGVCASGCGLYLNKIEFK